MTVNGSFYIGSTPVLTPDRRNSDMTFVNVVAELHRLGRIHKRFRRSIYDSSDEKNLLF